MATKKEIRMAVYDAFETATSGIVPADNITEEEPNDDDDLPAIKHSDAVRDVPMGVKTAPSDVSYNQDGEETTYHYPSVQELQFSATVISDDANEQEAAYDALVGYFEDFEYPIKSYADLHEDVSLIQVGDTNSSDLTGRSDRPRGDAVTINVQFTRFRDRDVVPTETVEQNVDSDNDGTTDSTYTTS